MGQSTYTEEEIQSQLVRTPEGIPVWRLVHARLANSAGVVNLAVDGSGGSPQSFSYSPPSTYTLVLAMVKIYMEGATSFTTTTFGDITTLGHGVEIKGDGQLFSTWKDNPDIIADLYDALGAAAIIPGGADIVLRGRWGLFEETNGVGILIKDKFEIIVNDDLSSLVRFNALITGRLVPKLIRD